MSTEGKTLARHPAQGPGEAGFKVESRKPRRPLRAPPAPLHPPSPSPAFARVKALPTDRQTCRAESHSPNGAVHRQAPPPSLGSRRLEGEGEDPEDSSGRCRESGVGVGVPGPQVWIGLSFVTLGKVLQFRGLLPLL